MRNVIRIVLALSALSVVVGGVRFLFTFHFSLYGLDPIPHHPFKISFIYVSYTIGIPLIVASVVGYIKKSKDIFWDILVGALVVMVIWPFTQIWPFTNGIL